MGEGYIKLYRKIQSHRFWTERRRMSRYEAFQDILLNASWRDRTTIVNGRTIHVKRGEICWSHRLMADRWLWGIASVKRFLNDLEAEREAERRAEHGITILTVVNYDTYQGSDDDSGTQAEHRRNIDGTQTERKEEVKEEKETTLASEPAFSAASRCDLQFNPEANQLLAEIQRVRTERRLPKLNRIASTTTRGIELILGSGIRNDEAVAAYGRFLAEQKTNADLQSWGLEGFANHIERWQMASAPAAPRRATQEPIRVISEDEAKANAAAAAGMLAKLRGSPNANAPNKADCVAQDQSKPAEAYRGSGEGKRGA